MLACRETDNKEHLLRFLVQYGNTFSKLEVLLFLSRHPQAKFSFDAVKGAGETAAGELVAGLRSLVDDGVVSEEVAGNDSRWYSLTTNRYKRKCVQKLSELDPGFVKRYWRECCGAGRC